MDLFTIMIVFVASIVACWMGGEVVRRKEIQLNRVGLALFHTVYVIGLAAAFLLL